MCCLDSRLCDCRPQSSGGMFVEWALGQNLHGAGVPGNNQPRHGIGVPLAASMPGRGDPIAEYLR
eukprot:2729824-Pyramimonas_sp.AAC.1